MSYPNYGYGVGYGTNPYYQGYQQPFQPNQFMNTNRQEQVQPMQNIQPVQDIPFSDVRYGTLDEAKGYRVAPSRAVMFIDQDKNEFYINRADSMGKPYLETYKYYPLSNLPQNNQTHPEAGKNGGISTDLGNFLTKKDAEMFPTRQELDEIYKKLEQLQKKIQLNKVIEEGNK